MCFYSQKFVATWTSWTIPLYKNLTICASLITISIIVTSVRFCGSVNCTNIPAWHFVLVFCLLLTCFVLFYLASTWKDKKPSRLMISCTILFIGKGNSHKDDFLGDFLFWEILFSRLSFLNFSSSDIFLLFLSHWALWKEYGFLPRTYNALLYAHEYDMVQAISIADAKSYSWIDD